MTEWTDEDREDAYEEWARINRMDHTDVTTMIAYEDWFEEKTSGHGEESTYYRAKNDM